MTIEFPVGDLYPSKRGVHSGAECGYIHLPMNASKHAPEMVSLDAVVAELAERPGGTYAGALAKLFDCLRAGQLEAFGISECLPERPGFQWIDLHVWETLRLFVRKDGTVVAASPRNAMGMLVDHLSTGGPFSRLELRRNQIERFLMSSGIAGRPLSFGGGSSGQPDGTGTEANTKPARRGRPNKSPKKDLLVRAIRELSALGKLNGTRDQMTKAAERWCQETGLGRHSFSNATFDRAKREALEDQEAPSS